jgi:hypothetical protein
MATNDQAQQWAAILTNLQALIGEIVTMKISELRASSEASTFSPSTNSVAANLMTSANLVGKLANVEQRLKDLECRFNKFESSIGQSNNINPKSESVDSRRLLDEMHTKFETTLSELQPTLQQIVNNQQQLEPTDCNKPTSTKTELEKCLEKCIIESTEQSLSAEVKTEKLQSDVNNCRIVHREVLSCE